MTLFDKIMLRTAGIVCSIIAFMWLVKLTVVMFNVR